MARGSAARAGESGEYLDREYYNPWRILCERLPHMIDEAQDARLAALELSPKTTRVPNYRGYYVGASAVAVDEHLRADGVETDINTMPTSSGSRVCAERRVVGRVEKTNRARKANFWIPGMVIVGEPQVDRATGAETKTLWPCGETCWPSILARRLPGDALIVTMKTDKHWGQVQTVSEMIRFYEAVRDGEDPLQPPLFDLADDRRNSIVERFDEIIPKHTDVLASPQTRAVAVNAARIAIQGFKQLRLV